MEGLSLFLHNGYRRYRAFIQGCEGLRGWMRNQKIISKA